MKRDKFSFPVVKKIFPKLLWRECRFCGREFRKESGYVIMDEVYINRGEYRYPRTYCCNECAKDEKDVIRYVKWSKSSPSISTKR